MTTTTKALTAPALSAGQIDGWLDAYGSAWEARDGAAAGRLFGHDAIYHWGPFAPPLEGSSAISRRWSVATNDQREIRFEHTTLAITADGAVVRWRATFTRLLSSVRTELDGVFVLRFDERCMCIELREWWLERELS
jgi:SnoaL-like domain